MQFAIFAGLGNQLFQFSLAHYYATSKGAKVSLVIDGNPQFDRPFELSSLLTNCGHVANFRIANFREERGRHKLQNISRYLPAFLRNFVFKITNLNYELEEFSYKYELVSEIDLNVGYYQNWRYVEDSWNFLEPELDAILDNELSKIKTSNFNFEDSIIVHVRRGDLIQSKATMGLLSTEYYLNALSQLSSSSRELKIIVLTDDLKNGMKVANEIGASKIIGPDELSSWQTLAVMANAKYLITANSTLSWWGAWISNKRGGKAIIPKPWFKSWPREVGDAFQFPGILTEKAIYE